MRALSSSWGFQGHIANRRKEDRGSYLEGSNELDMGVAHISLAHTPVAVRPHLIAGEDGKYSLPEPPRSEKYGF